MDVAKDVAKSAASRLRQYHRVYPKNPDLAAFIDRRIEGDEGSRNGAG